MTRQSRSARLVVAMVLAVGSVAAIGIAATPPNASLTVKHRTVTWSGGPLNGSAPSRRNETCSNGVSCDDFHLDIRVPANAFKGAKPLVTIKVATKAPNDIRLIISEPGLNDSVGTNNYAAYGSEATMIAPKSGVWRIRMACYVCAAATYTATATVAPLKPPPLEPAGAFKWQRATMPGSDIGEPGVSVDRSNNVFVNAPQDSDTGGGAVWASTDKGKSFTPHIGVDDPGISGDSDLAVAPDDGTVYFMNLAYGAFTNNVYVSRDHGSTWTGPSVAGAESDRQWFTAAPKGRVYVTYHDSANPIAQMYVLRSDDYGKTFVPMSSVALGAPNMLGTWCGNHQAGRPQVDPRNPDVYYMFYSTSVFSDCETADPTANEHYFTQVWIAKSVDGGRTFTHTLVHQSESTTDHNLMGFDVDKAGNLYIVIAESAGDHPDYRGDGPQSTHVKMFVSKDGGATWSKPILVDTLKDHHSNVFAAVSAGDAGRVNVAWYTSRSTSFDDSKASWTVAMAQSTNALSAHPTFTQMRVSTDVTHSGAICQAGLNCDLITGANRNLADFLGIDTGPDGAAHVVWTNDTSGKRLVEYARQTAGATLAKPKKR